MERKKQGVYNWKIKTGRTHFFSILNKKYRNFHCEREEKKSVNRVLLG